MSKNICLNTPNKATSWLGTLVCLNISFHICPLDNRLYELKITSKSPIYNKKAAFSRKKHLKNAFLTLLEAILNLFL
jgi:hypothetical protein